MTTPARPRSFSQGSAEQAAELEYRGSRQFLNSGQQPGLDRNTPQPKPYLNVPSQQSHSQGYHRRGPRRPGLVWHKEYSEDGLKSGRVLMIDYVKKDHTKEGMRKVAAQEISSVEGLRKVYSDPQVDREAVFRVFHVQNAHWATKFLVRKFNINDTGIVGTKYANWIRHKRPEKRAGKPVLDGKSWKTQHDPWRGISRMGWGMDYLKEYSMKDSLLNEDGRSKEERDQDVKMMELNCYGSEDEPIYGYDVYVQRISVYVQHKEIAAALPTESDIENPYDEEGYYRQKKRQTGSYVPHLETLDNENTVIIFDNSVSNSISDTLIPAREDVESRWRRLPFYLAYESKDISNDDHMAIECMKMVLQDTMKAVVVAWDSFLDRCYTHVSILEDKIYEQPADESRAPELWTNSANWLKVEKLMMIHIDVVRETKEHLTELTADDEEIENNWLVESQEDFNRLNNLVQEDLVKPTAGLADLMYKSVGIRDSRHSLELGASMWRLSWITFLFLPLTFLVGFFGMNVDTFANDPSIKYYFITSVPFMLLVLGIWYLLKNKLDKRHQSPYQRGVYEALFTDLATKYPAIWTRGGPKADVHPSGWSGWKWRLLLDWADPRKTIKAGTGIEDDGLGAWARFKRRYMRKWSKQIARSLTSRGDSGSSTDSLLEEGFDQEGAVMQGVGLVTETVALPGEAEVEIQQGGLLGVPLRRNLEAGGARRRDDSTGSKASSIMIEEKEPGWLKWSGERKRRSMESGRGSREGTRKRSPDGKSGKRESSGSTKVG